MPTSTPSNNRENGWAGYLSCCCAWVMLVVMSEMIPWLEFILGLTFHFSSDWIKEHKISIVGGPPKTMKLFEICENWPPRPNITKECPDIQYEYTFVGMLIASFLIPLFIIWIQNGISFTLKMKPILWPCAPGTGIVITNLGLAFSAILFIKSGRQSGSIVGIGKEVVILDGPYHLYDTMKVITGSFVLIVFTLRMIVMFIPLEPESAQETSAGGGSTNAVAPTPTQVDPELAKNSKKKQVQIKTDEISSKAAKAGVHTAVSVNNNNPSPGSDVHGL